MEIGKINVWYDREMMRAMRVFVRACVRVCVKDCVDVSAMFQLDTSAFINIYV